MIAMQYGFTLPADYDMGIIDRRIADKGARTDGFAGLGFKAYLTARKGEFGSRDNLYAPFYAWQDTEGLNQFVCGPPFNVLSHDFGRPSIRLWVPWTNVAAPGFASARFASRTIEQIEPGADLGALRVREIDDAAAAIASGARLASLAGFDPTGWALLRFSLFAELPDDHGDCSGNTQIYRVGHISTGEMPA